MIRQQAGAPVFGRITTAPNWIGGPRRQAADNWRTPTGPTVQQRCALRGSQYCRCMSEEQAGPAIGPTLSEWRKAREETEQHLATGATPPVSAEWVQRLADLLATERSWQDQYTELIALGSSGGHFPSSNR